MQRIYRVESAKVTIWRSHPPSLTVAATGECASSGWTDPELAAWRYISPPEDGFQDFDFLANPPAGISMPCLTPVAASELAQVDWANYWGPDKPLKGVRIHAQSNVVEAATMDATAQCEDLRGGGNPWPWQRRGAVPLPELYGKLVRLYRTGDVLTRDYHPDRCNIELDPSSERVVKVWFG